MTVGNSNNNNGSGTNNQTLVAVLPETNVTQERSSTWGILGVALMSLLGLFGSVLVKFRHKR
ncbi:hypothetical protein [Weissella paramesenteroides]